MELNRIIFTALYRTFSTSHGIEFMVNDSKIFYCLIPLSFMVCNRINYFFFKSVGSSRCPHPRPRQDGHKSPSVTVPNDYEGGSRSDR